jgi:hypothetical protein
MFMHPYLAGELTREHYRQLLAAAARRRRGGPSAGELGRRSGRERMALGAIARRYREQSQTPS